VPSIWAEVRRFKNLGYVKARPLGWGVAIANPLETCPSPTMPNLVTVGQTVSVGRGSQKDLSNVK